MPQYRVLGLLSSGHERATELASKLAVTKPTLTSLIDGLVERGYVAREAPTATGAPCGSSSRRPGAPPPTPAGQALRDVLDDVLARCADPTPCSPPSTTSASRSTPAGPSGPRGRWPARAT